MLEIHVTSPGQIRLEGRLDAAEAEHLAATFRTLVGPTTVDLAGLEYISSAGIAVLLDTFKRLRVGGHAFRLVNLQPRVRNVFAYAGLDRLLDIG
jgi:anti-anti-sigma factor